MSKWSSGPCLIQEVVVHRNELMATTSGDAGTETPAMTLEQFKEQLKELEKGLRSLPATAQVLNNTITSWTPS